MVATLPFIFLMNKTYLPGVKCLHCQGNREQLYFNIESGNSHFDIDLQALYSDFFHYLDNHRKWSRELAFTHSFCATGSGTDVSDFDLGRRFLCENA